MNDMLSAETRYEDILREMEEVEDGLRRHWSDAAGNLFSDKWHHLLDDMTECHQEWKHRSDRDEA